MDLQVQPDKTNTVQNGDQSSQTPDSNTLASTSLPTSDRNAQPVRANVSDSNKSEGGKSSEAKPVHEALAERPANDISTTTAPRPTDSATNLSNTVEVATEGNATVAVQNTRVDYLLLEPPAQAVAATWTPKEWKAHLATIDRGLESLLLDRQANNVSEGDFMTQSRRLGELKLVASEEFLKVARLPSDRDLGQLGKLESLSQLVGQGDRLRATELQSFALELAGSQSKSVARQASLVLLGFALNEIINDTSSNPEAILTQIDTVLSDRDQLRIPEFRMMEQVVMVLTKMNLPELASKVRQKTAEAFQGNTDLNLANLSWQMKATDEPTYQALGTELTKEPPVPELLRRALKDHLAKDSSDWVYLWLAEWIRELEFRGQSDAAGVLAETVDNAKFQSEAVHRIAAQEVDAYKSHIQMVGRPLVLSELADINGNVLDLARYKGKLVLVTYWASWCPTCRGEFPSLQTLHEQYKDKGLEIVGVNIDNTEPAMRSVLEVYKLPWQNFRSNNPQKFGMNSTAVQQVGLKATPFCLLIGSDGKIIAVQVHGQKLQELITEQLGT